MWWNLDVKSWRLVGLDKGSIFSGQKVAKGLLGVVNSLLYEFVKIALNSFQYNTGQHHTGEKGCPILCILIWSTTAHHSTWGVIICLLSNHTLYAVIWSTTAYGVCQLVRWFLCYDPFEASVLWFDHPQHTWCANLWDDSYVMSPLRLRVEHFRLVLKLITCTVKSKSAVGQQLEARKLAQRQATTQSVETSET